MSKGRSSVVDVRKAGPGHQVVTVVTKAEPGAQPKCSYMRKPCKECPWRKDQTGKFPAQAFRESARTAHDMATRFFSCHQQGTEKTAICAGFLLRNSANHLGVRMKRSQGLIKDDVTDGSLDLHESYHVQCLSRTTCRQMTLLWRSAVTTGLNARR